MCIVTIIKCIARGYTQGANYIDYNKMTPNKQEYNVQVT